MSIDVIHTRETRIAKCKAHGPGCSFGGWEYHIAAIGTGAIAQQIGINRCPSGLGVGPFLENDDARATGDDKAVPGSIVGTGGRFRSVVIGRR